MSRQNDASYSYYPLVLNAAPYALHLATFKFCCDKAYVLASYGHSVGVILYSHTMPRNCVAV
jgi:hypothetical protein